MDGSSPYEVRQLIEEGRRLYASGERARALQCWEHALGIDPTAQEARDLLSQAGRMGEIGGPVAPVASQSGFDPESTGPIDREDLDWAEILGERGRSNTDEPPPLPAHFEGGEPLFVDMDATIAMPGRADEAAAWGVEEGHLSAHESAEFDILEVPDEDPLKMPMSAFSEPETGEPSHIEEPSWRFIDTSPVPFADASMTDLTNPSIQTGSTVDVFDDTFSAVGDGESVFSIIGEEWDPEETGNDIPVVEVEPVVETPPPLDRAELSAGLEALVRTGLAEIEEAEAGISRASAPIATGDLGDDPTTLMNEAMRRRQADDFTGSLAIVEQVLELEPDHVDALEYLRENTARLLGMYRSRLGSMDRVPRIRLRQQEIVWQSLDHREGFILSQVDGETTYDEIITISGMAELDCTRILARLIERGVIG